MGYFYIRQEEGRSGQKIPKYLTNDNTLDLEFNDHFVRKLHSQMQANELAVKCERWFGGKFAVWAMRGNRCHRTAFSTFPDRLTVSDIERRMMAGKAVSPSDVSRFARTPRGMMLISSMRRGA